MRATGEIGLFKILSEGSVAAGVRRIEAVAGSEALAHIHGQEQVLRELQGKLQAKVEQLPEQVERLLEANRALEKELAELKRQSLLGSSMSCWPLRNRWALPPGGGPGAGGGSRGTAAVRRSHPGSP